MSPKIRKTVINGPKEEPLNQEKVLNDWGELRNKDNYVTNFGKPPKNKEDVVNLFGKV